MANQNLNKLWKKLENLYKRFDKKRITDEKLYEEVDKLIQTDENKQVANNLGLILLSKHEDLLEAHLTFACPLENKTYSSFDNKEKILYVDPMMTIKFWQECQDIDLEDKINQTTEQAFCKASFQKQLSKLPSKLILFLIILKQLAVSANLNQVNYTEGVLPQDDTSFYQTILWGFNTLETTIEQLHGTNIRTRYGITWHQSEWAHSSNSK